MYEIADREDGGPWLVNGAEIHPRGQGVKNKGELDLLVERAAEESPPVLPSIRELLDLTPKSEAEFNKWIEQQKQDHGNNWNFRYLQPYTHGIDIGTLQMARINGEQYVGVAWNEVVHFAENEWMGTRRDTPQWMNGMSRRFNAALRHSVGCRQDKKGHQGLPCDEAGWVSVERFLKYDHFWQDGYIMEGTLKAIIIEAIIKRWNMFQQIIFTEYKITKRTRAQVLALKVTKKELLKVIYKDNNFTRKISRETLKIDEGDDDREKYGYGRLQSEHRWLTPE